MASVAHRAHGGRVRCRMERMIPTNMGKMPLEDYMEIKAMQLGFDSYEDLKNQGFDLEVYGGYNEKSEPVSVFY